MEKNIHPKSKECAMLIKEVMVQLLLKEATTFFGIVSAKLRIVEENKRCKTLATDGRRLMYNVSYIMGIDDPVERAKYQDEVKQKMPHITPEQLAEVGMPMTREELMAGIVHESLHCAFEHFIRMNSRNRRRWNLATDYEINQIIKREKIGTLRKTWLYDPKFEGKSAEEIYTMLPDDEDNGGGSGSNGSISGRGEPLDHHFDPDTTDDEDDVYGDMDPGEFEESIADFKQTITQAQQAGNVPADLARRLNDFNAPKINWRNKLKRTFLSMIKHNQSFQRPNRKSWSIGVILPGFLPEETIDICVALDMSGSISNAMALDFISEVYGMTKQFPTFKIHLVSFDTSVYCPESFDETTVDKLKKYTPRGGGGTRFDAVWQHLKEKKLKPKQIVMFTDGYPCGSWGDPKYCDTLFVIHGSKTIVAPFGKTAYYEPK